MQSRAFFCFFGVTPQKLVFKSNVSFVSFGPEFRFGWKRITPEHCWTSQQWHPSGINESFFAFRRAFQQRLSFHEVGREGAFGKLVVDVGQAAGFLCCLRGASGVRL
jgi:hypothetical protein